LAYILLVKKIETSVCIFEKENRLGGKIYDHVFSQAPDRTVGQFSVKKQRQNVYVCFNGGSNVFLHCPNFLQDQKVTGKAEVNEWFFGLLLFLL